MITSSTMEYFDSSIVPLEFELTSYGNEMTLSLLELAYQVVQSFSNPPSSQIDRANRINDDYSPLPWLEPISLPDPFNNVFLTDESIMEFMNLD